MYKPTKILALLVGIVLLTAACSSEGSESFESQNESELKKAPNFHLTISLQESMEEDKPMLRSKTMYFNKLEGDKG